jgi:hypothetical protein
MRADSLGLQPNELGHTFHESLKGLSVVPDRVIAPLGPRASRPLFAAARKSGRPSRGSSAAVWAGAGVAGAAAAVTVLLWGHYGSAVFFEMIVAGLASCF